MSEFFTKITDLFLISSYFILSFLSFVISLLIIFSAKYIFKKRFEKDAKAKQSAHYGYVPRVGGLAIYITILGFSYLLNNGVTAPHFLPNLYTGDTYWLILSAMPIFLIGLLEDLGIYMSPKTRLLGTLISGILVVIWFGIWVGSIGLPVFDLVLGVTPLGIAFTLFATTGVVHGFNLVDGLNGLVGYLTLSSVVALSVIAFQNADLEMQKFLFLLAASVVGFLLLNFPFGKIFLGDAGAYTLGHILVWSSILLLNTNPQISPFSIFLIFFWPVADTILSIWRRFRLSKRAYHPDRLHFHQLVMRFLEIRYFGRGKRHITNPLSTVIMVPLISVPQVLGVLFWNNFLATVWCTMVVILLFVSTYFVGIGVAKKSRKLND